MSVLSARLVHARATERTRSLVENALDIRHLNASEENLNIELSKRRERIALAVVTENPAAALSVDHLARIVRAVAGLLDHLDKTEGFT